MSRFLSLLVAAAVAASAAQAEMRKDIEYGQAGGERLLLDAHVPDGKGPFPIAILVHGGGWSSGDKGGSNRPGDGADISPWFGLLSEANFTWFSINYRLASKNRWPADIEDLDTAIRWVKAHAAEFKGDPKHIVLFGHSAGGHLVMYAATQDDPTIAVQGVVGFAPVTDLVADSERRGGLSQSLQNLFGLAKEITPNARNQLMNASPINRVRPEMPPILVVHGDADRTVPIQQSIAFVAKLQAAGDSAELVIRTGVPHSLVAGEKIDTSYRAKVIAWLRRVLGEAVQESDNASSEDSGPWVPDLGNGTYRNPVLFADYSDPDVIRVGNDFWLVSSSFSDVPGLPILHSRDLVNWTIENHALAKLVPADRFAVPRHGEGVWAPSIRYHAGRFYIYYPDPDFGIYVITASDPRALWSAPKLVCAGKGLIDPCPYWDDDGKTYLIHAWARSRAGVANRLSLVRLASDGMTALDEGQTIIDADKIPGWRTLEGPKLYRRGDYYYIFAPAGGVAVGFQAVFRAHNIFGPYENRIVLAQGNTPINGPHQGAWVDTAGGENWFLHFQDRGPFGRVVHLEPMTWGDDGWPRIGAPGPNQTGQPVLVHAKPDVPKQPIAVPAASDEFDAGSLGLQWQWQANAGEGWASLTARSGVLRLKSVQSSGDESLWGAPNLLLQKFPAPRFVATTQIDLKSDTAGEEAGLIILGYDYAWIGPRQTAAGRELVQIVCHDANEGGREAVSAIAPIGNGPVTVRVAVAEDAICHFFYSIDGDAFRPIGAQFLARGGRWVGAKIGLFASARSGIRVNGYADFDWFRVARE